MQKNRVELAGYLAAKPALRRLPSGTKVANARLAEGYKFADKDKKIREHTNWHSLSFYGTLADVAVTYEKGDNIAVEGTLQTRRYTPQDGSQRTVYEVVVRTCHLIAPRGAQHEALPANESDAHDEPPAQEQLAGEVPLDAEWPV